MVSNTEVMIALSMPDTVHYRSHVDGDCTSEYKELIGEARNTFRCFRTEKFSGPASDDDDKNVENFKRMRRYGRNQDGQNKGNGAPRPTAHVVIRCLPQPSDVCPSGWVLVVGGIPEVLP